MAELTGDLRAAAVKGQDALHDSEAQPVPPDILARDGSTRKNRSNTLGIASAGMPTPVSDTSMRIAASSFVAASVTVPPGFTRPGGQRPAQRRGLCGRQNRLRLQRGRPDC
jgi:hypothetical protein